MVKIKSLFLILTVFMFGSASLMAKTQLTVYTAVEAEDLFKRLLLEDNYNLSKIMSNYRKNLKAAFAEQSPRIYPHLKNFLRSTNLKVGIVSNAHHNYILKILKKNNLYGFFKGNITCLLYTSDAADE